MATLRDIRNRISGVKSIEKITSAMKMVSSIKVRRAQKQVESARPYFEKIEKMLANVMQSIGNNYENPLFASQNDEVKNVVICVVAGDKGLCGSFNNGLFKYVNEYLEREFKEKYPNAEAPQLILFGNKSIEYFSKKNYKILHNNHNTFQPLNYSTVLETSNFITKNFVDGKIDRVDLFYNKFINLMKQEPKLFTLLPIELKLDSVKLQNIPEYIYEPDFHTIIDLLVKQYIDLNIWGPLIESNAAEQAARLLAMDKATQNAEDLIKELNLQFNNARQSAITTEMLEIVGGAEALKS